MSQAQTTYTGTRYLGIDPGVTGAVAMIQHRDSERMVAVADTPVVETHTGTRRKHDFNIAAMRQLLVNLMGDGRNCCAVIEEVHGWPGMDTRSVTSLIRGAGLWEGLCAGLGIPVHRVSPLAWKRHHRLLKTDKAESRVRAAQQFPLQELGPKTKTGRADALLIATYGRAMNY
jgi:crossover junction endodeoxyribonuclease RuvC